MNVVFLASAEADLEDIGDFIARDNPARAVTFIEEMREHCRALEKHPELGPARPEIAHDARMLVHAAYLILYRIHNEQVEIVRVVHGARDQAALMGSE